MGNLIKRMDNYFKSFDGVRDEEMKKIFMHYYWYLYKISGFVSDLSTSKGLFLTVIRNVFLLCTFFWHELLFIYTVPLVYKESHVLIRVIHLMTFVSFTLILYFWFAYFQRRRVTKIHRIIIKGFHSYGHEGEEIRNKLVKNFRITFIRALSIPPVFVFASVVFMFFSTAVDEATGSPPQKDPENGVDIYLPLPMWYPWDIKKWHYFQMIHDFILAGYVGIIISMSVLIFVNLAYTVVLQLELLNVSISMLEARSLKLCKEWYPTHRVKKSFYRDEKFLKCYEYCLNQNIEHHQNIHISFVDMNKLGEVPIFCAFGMEALVLGISGLDLVTGGERIGDFILNILLCLAEASTMAVLCWFGQRIIDMSEQVKESIYNTKWYLCSKNLRNTIKVVQLGSSRRLALIGIIWPCDLASFQAVMNSAYSYFNLLMAFRE